jgi:hypothetical protein
MAFCGDRRQSAAVFCEGPLRWDSSVGALKWVFRIRESVQDRLTLTFTKHALRRERLSYPL